jgi:phosphate transport system permease protein
VEGARSSAPSSRSSAPSSPPCSRSSRRAVAFGIAFFLTELAPPWLRRPVGTAIELLAAVPSIIYGMWGLFVIVPFVQMLHPARLRRDRSANAADRLPVPEQLLRFGTGIFTASLVLAIMILPFIAATMRDVFEQVPPVYKESAYGLGATPGR